MTTKVTIEACCAKENTEVKVTILDDGTTGPEEFILQDGESADRFVYDGRMILVREVSKQ